MRSYYNKYSGLSQYQGVLSRPIAGLNEYTPPTEITDNHLSDCIDVLPHKDHALEFPKLSFTPYFYNIANNHGMVRAVLPSYLADEADGEIISYVFGYGATKGWTITKATYNDSINTIKDYSDISAYQTKEDSDATACIFNTEAERYYCFANQVDTKIFYIRENTDAFGYINTPFNIQKMVVHASRIFALDTRNTLWWSRAGDIYTWYSGEYDNDAISDAQEMKVGGLTVTNQPNTGRLITFLHEIVDTADTIGYVVLTGKFNGMEISESVVLVEDNLAITQRRFDEITGISQIGWIQSGASPDTITIGTGPVGSKYLQEDAGYWTVETEEVLNDMCVLGDTLYIFASHNIYAFQGYSYDTFSLTKVISDIGLTKPDTSSSYGHSSLAVIKNVSFFKYNNDIYRFDGSSTPVIISKPVTTNGGSVNGVFGGIDISGNSWSLTADDDDLYVYQNTKTPLYHYRYNYQTKTWWKFSGITKTDMGTSSDVTILMVSSYTRKYMYMFVSKLHATAPTWLMSTDHSFIQDSKYPYIVTKAFNTQPSENGTLTGIILHARGTDGAKATINVSYSVDDIGGSFITVKTYSDYEFDGGSEILEIPVPVAGIARKHSYRLKVEINCGTKSVYLYNIERRFRITRRSR